MSISRTVKSLVDNDLALQDALYRGYANYSAIARMIKPVVEEILGRKIKTESIITSIKRSKLNYQILLGNTTKIIANSVINLKTGVAKISVERTNMNLNIIRRTLSDLRDVFLQVNEGESTITLITTQKKFNDINSLFREKEILDKKENLAAIIIQSPREIVKTPGCALTLYYPLARKKVNIEETMSCYTDTIIVLPMKDVGKALTALTDLITDARKQLKTNNIMTKNSRI